MKKRETTVPLESVTIALAGQDKRQCERREAFGLAEIKISDSEIVGSVVNISSSGIKLQIVEGLMPAEGEVIMVRLADGGDLVGHVVWIEGRNLGVGFDSERPDLSELIWPEISGQKWFGRVVQLQVKRQRQ